MNKRKKNILLHAGLPFIALAIVVVGIYLWFFAPKDYRDLIPAESKAVVSLDAQMVQKLVEAAGLPMADGAAALGIATDEALFAFITPNEYFALTASVIDARKVTQLVVRLAKTKAAGPVRHEDGVSLVWLSRGWQLAWTDKALLLLGPGTAQLQDELRQTALQLFKARRTASFRYSDKASLFDELEGEVRLYCAADALPSPLGLLLRLGTPAGADPGKVQLFASFTKGADGLQGKGQLTSTDDAVREQLETYAKSLPSASQLLLPADASAGVLSLAARVRGEEAERLLLTDATAKPLLAAISRDIDLRTVLRSVSGLTLHVEALGKDFVPTFSLLAPVDSTKQLAPAEKWIRTSGLPTDSASVRRAGRGYVLQRDGRSLFFGQADGYVWFASQEQLVPTAIAALPKAEDTGRISVQVDAPRLLKQPALQGTAAALLKNLLGSSQRLTLKLADDGKFELSVQ